MVEKGVDLRPTFAVFGNLPQFGSKWVQAVGFDTYTLGVLEITNDPFSPMIGKGMGLDSGITRPCL